MPHLVFAVVINALKSSFSCLKYNKDIILFVVSLNRDQSIAYQFERMSEVPFLHTQHLGTEYSGWTHQLSSNPLTYLFSWTLQGAVLTYWDFFRMQNKLCLHQHLTVNNIPEYPLPWGWRTELNSNDEKTISCHDHHRTSSCAIRKTKKGSRKSKKNDRLRQKKSIKRDFFSCLKR